MTSVYVAVLTFFLHGGLVMTQTTIAQSEFECIQGEILLLKDYKKKGQLYVADRLLSIEEVQGSRCFKVTKSTI